MNVTMLLIPAFTTLNARMNGINCIIAASGIPVNIGVMIMFAKNITTVIAIVPATKPIIAVFFVIVYT